ncbi:NF-kappa-B inhibitor-like protein 2 [Sarotherodon galilaeus]
MMASATEKVETAAEDSYTLKWTKEQTAEFIRLRLDNEHLFTGAKHTAARRCQKMDLAGKISPGQAKRKWENLKRKYKECKYPATGEGASGKPTAATWPWPSTRPLVLISSIQEDTPGPSAVVGNPLPDQEEQEDVEQLEARVLRRKRDGEDDLIALLKDDMAQQHQMEEHRAERMDRLLGVLEKLVEQKKD